MINITKGSDKVINIAFVQDGAPWTLAGTTAIQVLIPASSTLTKTLASGAVAITSESGGTATVTLTDVETLTLRPGNAQYIEIIVDKGTVRKIFQCRDILNVTDRLLS